MEIFSVHYLVSVLVVLNLNDITTYGVKNWKDLIAAYGWNKFIPNPPPLSAGLYKITTIQQTFHIIGSWFIVTTKLGYFSFPWKNKWPKYTW